MLDTYLFVKKTYIILLGTLIIFFIIWFLGAWMFPNGPWDIVAEPYVRPWLNSKYVLGTDPLGRNILAEILYGARTSILISIVSSVVGSSVGILIGISSGYFGGMIDKILSLLIDAFQCIPSFLLSMVFLSIVAPSELTIILALCLTLWPPVARLVRVEVMCVIKSDYIAASRCIGMSTFFVMYKHIIPNSVISVKSIFPMLISISIITEAGLAFLGLDDPNVMSWGSIINIGRSSLRSYSYIVLLPCCCIIALVIFLTQISRKLSKYEGGAEK